MKDVVAALANKGCQHILYIYNSLTYSGRHKLDGFRQGIKELNLPHKAELIQQTPRTLTDTEALIDRLVAGNVTSMPSLRQTISLPSEPASRLASRS